MTGHDSDPGEDAITIIDVAAWQWVCPTCGDNGSPESDISFAEDAPHPHSTEVVDVVAWTWECGDCGDSGNPEADPSLAADSAADHICSQ